MKKIIAGLILISSVSSFAGGVIADLQYECVRAVMSYNEDINPIHVYNASTFLNKKKVILADQGSLIEGTYKKINGGIVIRYDGGYENENELTILFGDNYKTPSKLVLGERSVRMICKEKYSL